MQSLNLVTLSVILGGIRLATPTNIEAVVYYVAQIELYCQEYVPKPCYPLETYLKNSTEFFKDGMDISMNFLNGTYLLKKSAVEFTVNLSILKIVGESQGSVIIESAEPHEASWLIQGGHFHMEKLIVSRLKFNISVDKLNVTSLVFRGGAKLNIFHSSQNSTAFIVDTDFVNHSSITLKGNKAVKLSIRDELNGCRFQHNSFIKVAEVYIVSISRTQFVDISYSIDYAPGPFLMAYYSAVTLTDVSFDHGYYSAVLAHFSEISFHGEVNFTNNSGRRGGALAFYCTTLYIDNNVTVNFINNSAREFGGATYLNQDIIMTPDHDFRHFYCFYQVLQAKLSDSYVFNFENNRASLGGNDIYGTSIKSECLVSSDGTRHLIASKHFHFRDLNNSLSSVSADPSRVCLCNEQDIPQCADKLSSIFTSRKVYPGDTITISAVLVGGDFGTTVGTVLANFLDHNTTHIRIISSQNSQEIIRPYCTDLNFTLYANENANAVMYLTPHIYSSKKEVRSEYYSRSYIQKNITAYHERNTIPFGLLTTPIYVTITTLLCPMGFSLIGSECKCDHKFYEVSDDVQCYISNRHAFIEWSGDLWIGIDNHSNELVYNRFCPYCNKNRRKIDILCQTGFDVQCQTNRKGILCGECKEGYSLAIGSSRCISCSNNNNVALVIFFAAAGLLLISFISILNLTVSRGMINGLVFYANIIWAYQESVMPSEGILFIQTFLAWLNLDFGIETCFINGLTALGKTWLQFVFPVYTAGLFFIGLRFSKKLSNLVGDRAVPTLATLLFLSHSDLLRTIIQAIGSLQIYQLHDTGRNSTFSQFVWSGDGNVDYSTLWHVLLVLVASLCFSLLWLPYTLLLLSMQWIRKVHNSRLSRWVTRYKPFFDAYYAPLKDKHHYWFGTLLMVKGFLLILSSLARIHLDHTISLLIVLVSVATLLSYMNFMQVYQSTSVLAMESLFFINLILLSGGIMYIKNENDKKKLLVSISVGFVCLKLCVIIIWSVIRTYCSKRNYLRRGNRYTSIGDEGKKLPCINKVEYRDSIFQDSEHQN